MQTHVTKALTEFLKNHCDKKRPLLVGFSGGPDSMALLHALNMYAKEHSLFIGVAHVDHSWREESAKEAHALSQMVEAMGLPYHEKVLDPTTLIGNLESACREERYRFFAELQKTYGYQAVLTGHHSDDVAETVLKRLFEGATLPLLAGIHETILLHECPVWRPLLKISKSQILDYIAHYNLPIITDKTNLDPRYLRGRMRTGMIPALCESFGKQVTTGLYRIAEESEELCSFLNQRTKEYLKALVVGPFGCYLDLREFTAIHPVELKFLIRQLCDQMEVFVSREVVDSASDMLLGGEANKSFGSIQIDRGRFFIFKNQEIEVPLQPVTIGLNETIRWGGWKVECAFAESPVLPPCSWKELWQGRGTIALPAATYELVPSKPSYLYPGTNPVSKWWTEAQVPAFLRQMAPLIMTDGQLACELLSGCKPKQNKSNGLVLSFTLYG